MYAGMRGLLTRLDLGVGGIELKIDLALDYVTKAKEVQALIELLPDPEDVGPVVSPKLTFKYTLKYTHRFGGYE